MSWPTAREPTVAIAITQWLDVRHWRDIFRLRRRRECRKVRW